MLEIASNMSEAPKATKKSKLMFFWSLATVATIWFVWSASAGGGNRSWQLVSAGNKPEECVANTRMLHTRSNESADGSCLPQRRIVFIKTHKTASSTTASILERFGYLNNLSFAVRPLGHILTETSLFHRSVVAGSSSSSSKKNCSGKDDDSYDMLTNHARYNRPEMEAVIHHAKYVTILREPVAQFESAFAYFDVPDKLGLNKFDNPLEEFMREPKTYFNMRTFDYFWQMMRNGQLFDLGLDHEFHDDEYTVDYKIASLDKELDLVMLTEYFHESLVLLRKLLCWSFEDMLYISNGVRVEKRRFDISTDLKDRIQRWNWADVRLYEHFNRTFWKRVAEYGPDFHSDLATFRRMQKDLSTECINYGETENDGRELTYQLKSNASLRCKDILRGDVGYTSLIQERMRANGEVSSRFSLAYIRDIYYSVFPS